MVLLISQKLRGYCYFWNYSHDSNIFYKQKILKGVGKTAQQLRIYNAFAEDPNSLLAPILGDSQPGTRDLMRSFGVQGDFHTSVYACMHAYTQSIFLKKS